MGVCGSREMELQGDVGPASGPFIPGRMEGRRVRAPAKPPRHLPGLWAVLF